MKSLAKLKKIKGDASFREFYRNKENKSIVVITLFLMHNIESLFILSQE